MDNVFDFEINKNPAKSLNKFSRGKNNIPETALNIVCITFNYDSSKYVKPIPFVTERLHVCINRSALKANFKLFLALIKSIMISFIY